jgi:hypothetical protein
MFGYTVILICSGTSSREGLRKRGVHSWRFRSEEKAIFPPDKVMINQNGTAHPCIQLHKETHIEFLDRRGKVIAHAPLSQVDGIGGDLTNHPDFYKTLCGEDPSCPFS